MIVEAGTIIIGVLTWAGNKAVPAVWSYFVNRQAVRIQQAKDLCDNHGDCEAEKIQSLQGAKPVYLLPVKPVPVKTEPIEGNLASGK